MCFGIMAMQLNALIPPDLPADQVLTHIAQFDHAGLVRELANRGFRLIELGGDLSIFLPHTFQTETVNRLAALKAEQDLSYTVHLPLWSVEPSTLLTPVREGSVQREFHISRQTRDFYGFDQSLFSFNGNVIFADFHAARLFTEKINQKLDLVSFPEQAVKAGQINALGLVDEILHLVIAQYRRQRSPQALEKALERLYEKFGKERVDAALIRFSETFPPAEVYLGKTSLEDYLTDENAMEPRLQVQLEELLMLWIANVNPACSPYLELFDDSELKKETLYSQMIAELRSYFKTQPTFGSDDQDLIEMLRSPAIASPHSLPGQLEYIRTKWSALLGEDIYRLLSSLDLIKEEEKAIFAGPGPAYIYEFHELEFEAERFSPDRDWMPQLVLIAKNVYVWLDQLSKKYHRSITQLDQIPDEELDRLARWGFTGLWLIGLWERSPASKMIKQIRGNPEAVASAYSLTSYEIASELGGDAAYQRLRDQAWQRGIRLAADMVPNHMGIDSKWVIEHADWFLGSQVCPYPSYRFSGQNLSGDERVGIYLEDHYLDNSDAAVVFKRLDFWTGNERFIYHGNDGTSMPWNDTAQLNYLNPDVREAVIQTILNVARKFSIIRFDAAMTLAKKHYQRLWFPEPGSGGAIPSRAENGLKKSQFDQQMPVEFWREVVDRVAQEVPDTLLLAEAFWLMEGYFVRTLGMHRVYNSAFMNMLRDEKNQEYRLVIKNTLEFDPEILKRYVNFMNNPDERTAVDQFGKGEKYFGVCTLLATMPGLPMFGHGQIEGFAEKYGMEYRRAYWDEQPDSAFVERHEREIFPLLRRRYLFAEVRDFLLYDFYTPAGTVNEDVFAYSNRLGEARSLVVYHNKYASTNGWIRSSAAFSVKVTDSPGGERVLMQKTLAEGLGLSSGAATYTILRDHISGLEFIRENQQLHQDGLYIELEAYKCQVFVDIREVVEDESHPYSQLAAFLSGRGVPSIDAALAEIFLQPVHKPYRELVNAGQFAWLIANRLPETGEEQIQRLLVDIKSKLAALFESVRKFSQGNSDTEVYAAEISLQLAGLLKMTSSGRLIPTSTARRNKAINTYLFGSDATPTGLRSGDLADWGTLLGWLFSYKLGKVSREQTYTELSRSWIDQWRLGKILDAALRDLGLDENARNRVIAQVKVLTSQAEWFNNLPAERQPAYPLLESWLRESEIQHLLGVNRHQDVLWFNKEAFEKFLWWMQAIAVIQLYPTSMESDGAKNKILRCFQIVQELLSAEENSGYQVDKLLTAARGS